MRKKDRKWLEHVRHMTDGNCGMYAGVRSDHLPDGPANRLASGGFIRLEFPHNPVHYGRWEITSKGRRELDEETEVGWL